MATYPNGVKTFTNPTGTDAMNSATVPHATQHAAVNDEITAIETDLKNASAGYASLEEKMNNIDSVLQLQIFG